MLARMKQVFSYFFGKFDEDKNRKVKEFLTTDEFFIFDSMNEYDKVHSFGIYEKMLDDSGFKNDEDYKKLALLHDSGKGSPSFFKRIKKVIVGDRELEKHPMNAYIKLKDINLEVAKLCRDHHLETSDYKMKKFQELDEG